MTTEPLVSVIIPVYNHEIFVEKALNSVLYQTYPNLELIIIDDGSKDKSVNRVEECLDKWQSNPQIPGLIRNLSFITQSNQGAHATINRGLNLAKGSFLTILNSDDYFHPERISLIIKKTAAAKAQLAFSYVTGINETDRALASNHWWHRWYEKSKMRLFRSPTIGFLLLQENLAVSTGNLFFTRELYEKTGPFKDLKLAHDLDFLLRALIYEEPLLIRENLYFYRIHSSNTQHQVQHLMAKEKKEIYRSYLTSVFPHPPQNQSAPCHWYWPLEFARIRLNLGMDQSLQNYMIQRPACCEERSRKTENRSQESEDWSKKKETWFNKFFKKSRVCLVSHDLSLSGAPRVVADLAILLKQQGYIPTVISMQDGPLREELEKKGVVVYAAKGSLLKRILSLLFFACVKPNSLTLVNSMASWPFVCLMALFHPFSTIKWYIHETARPRTLDGRISYYLFKWFNWKAKRRFWFGSESTKEAWSQFGIDGDVVYWSGIPQQTPCEKVIRPINQLLSVGTASARKGTHHLVEAFLYCLEKKLIPQSVKLTIIGFPNVTSPDFIGLEDLILRVVTSKFQNNIQLISSISSDLLNEYYHQADLFIQSSTLECLPLSLLKAMSLGLPIITTDVNGCAEAIKDEENGTLCFSFDRYSLAQAIEKMVNNPLKSWKMGRCAQDTFNVKFSTNVTERKFFHLIQKVRGK